MPARTQRADVGPGVQAHFTDRFGGVSAPPYDELNLATHVGDAPAAVADNRARLHHALPALAGIAWMAQQHGAEVAVVEAVPAPPPAVDALVTSVPGLALSVLVADCIPVLMADAQAGVVAAVHVGRRGLDNGVALRALRAMYQVGARPGHVAAALGPSIGACCYEVPEPLQQDIGARHPVAVARTTWGTPSLDLRRGLMGVLHAHDVDARPVGGCTAEDALLFSHRRDGVTGRQAGVVWMEP